MTFQSHAATAAVLAFMALVTGAVLGLLLTELARGLQGLPAAAVYGVTAAFGVRFLVASWPALWRSS